MSTRIDTTFARLRGQNKAALVTFVTAGDPNEAVSRDILAGLAQAGADVIELGMPFSDPMADGPAIQQSSQRALATGMTLRKTLAMVADFRRIDDQTPIVLMGYFNPIHQYGVERFLRDAKTAGVDGFIIVDLPPEEEAEFAAPAKAAGMNFIYLTTPTADDARLDTILSGASGFVYYVSITGVTGTASADAGQVNAAIDRLRGHTDLPLAVGFGIKTPGDAATFARFADAAVVGSALVAKVTDNLDDAGQPGPDTARAVLDLVRDLADGVASARS